MSNIRIKDLSTEATSLGTDDFIPVDGNTSGTRKISKENLGTTLEIPDVGTAPNETPLNQHLGSLAYQSADSVAMGTVEAESLTIDSGGSTQPTQSVVTNAGAEGSALELRNSAISADTATALTFTNSTIAGANYGKAKIAAVRTNEANGNTDIVISTSASGSLSEAVRIDSSGRLGVNNTSPGTNANSNADDLVVGNGGDHGITIYSGTGDSGRLFFSDGTGTSTYRGYIRYDHGSNSMYLGTNSAERVRIDASGRLGVNQTSPGSYSAGASNLVVGSGSGAEGISIITGTASKGSIYFGDGTGASAYRGQVQYDHNTNQLEFGTQSAIRWYISSSGDLVANGAHGIDFGSGASTTIDAYEHGDITSVTDASGAGLGITADLKYQVIGKSVQISGKIIFPTTTDTRAARVTLLPEQCPNDDGARGLSVSYSTTGSGLYVMPIGNTNDVMFWNLSGTSQQNSDLSGYVIFISGNYSLN